jgi:transketolase N-terminal domain/subunit
MIAEQHDGKCLAMDAVEKANSGHPGLPMGAADVATVLFTRFLKFDPSRSALARPRPLRAVGRPWLDAALFAALSDRLRRT